MTESCAKQNKEEFQYVHIWFMQKTDILFLLFWKLNIDTFIHDIFSHLSSAAQTYCFSFFLSFEHKT